MHYCPPGAGLAALPMSHGDHRALLDGHIAAIPPGCRAPHASDHPMSHAPSRVSALSCTRRQQLAMLPSIAVSLPPFLGGSNACHAAEGSTLRAVPNYAAPGPFQAIQLPNLEHTCTVGGCSAAPADRARLKIKAWVPKGGVRLGLTPPFPLAIITPGFLLTADQYTTYAIRLASWGFIAVVYDSAQAALDPLSDVVCVSFLKDLIDWCRTSVPLGRLADTGAVYLIGHSRGAKISALAAASDPRVQALFLIDPVDTTVYAPLSPEYPSAVTALEGLGSTGRALPLAVVGSGRGGDCVPKGSNYETFYEASTSPAWEAVVSDAGHLQFLDGRGGSAMDLVCASGKIPDAAVATLTQAMMVAWGELMVRRRANVDGTLNSGDETRNDDNIDNAGTTVESTVRLGVDGEGRIVTGVGRFDALQVLYSTESAVRASLNCQMDLEMTTRVKNFELP